MMNSIFQFLYFKVEILYVIFEIHVFEMDFVFLKEVVIFFFFNISQFFQLFLVEFLLLFCLNLSRLRT